MAVPCRRRVAAVCRQDMCDDSHALSVHEFEDHYYELVDDALTWSAASARAATYSYKGAAGHLVTITSAAESAFLTSIRATGWAGGNDIAREGAVSLRMYPVS